MPSRTQLYSLVDRLFLIDEDIRFTSKNLSELRVDDSFIKQYENLKFECDVILTKIKDRKEKTETIKVK